MTDLIDSASAELEETYTPDDPDDFPWDISGDPELVNPIPQFTVQNWRIVAVGHRPEDYMGRDLLLGSLMRDERPRAFQWMSKKPLAWMNEMVTHLPVRDQKQALQFLCLHLLHRENLARLLDRFRFSAQWLRRLWRCRPCGVLTEWVGRADWRTERDICGLHWLCPWCFCRRATKLYERLNQGPLRNSEGRYLVRAKASVTALEIKRGDAIKRWVEQHGIDHEMGLPWDMRATIVQRDQFAFVRGDLGAMFRCEAAKLGVTDGLLFHQVGPHRTAQGQAL